MKAITILPALALGLLLACGGTATSSAPTITSFTPTSGQVATTVTVTGTGFSLGINSVHLGGVEVASGTITSDTRISFVVPAAALTGPITVEATGGTATSATDFIVDPAITGVSPRTGSAAAGTPVTVTGTGLMGITAIHFGATLATATRQTAEEIVVPVPATATPGALEITFTVDSSYNLADLLSAFTVTE